MSYNKVRDIKIGLEIFEKYGATMCCAAHDVFRAGQPDGVALTAEEVAKLRAAGWFISSSDCNGCGGPDHHATCNYWSIFI